MKKLICLGLLFLFCSSYQVEGSSKLPSSPYNPVPYFAPVSVSFQIFYDRLSPYGTWVSYPSYGYVWVPSAGPGFAPYASGGHWENTYDYGWIWVSDYDWGWAPFHYGRWHYDNFYGWMWVPGYQWAPAWVTWGYYDSYYGWAPLGPGVGYTVGYRPPINHWCFVPRNHITSPTIINYRVQNTTINRNNITVINESRTYNDTRYFSGPRTTEVEKATGQRLAPKALTDAREPSSARVSGKQVSVFRPSIDRESVKKAVPAKVESLENLKRVNTSATGKPVQGTSIKPTDKRLEQAKPISQEKKESVKPAMERSKQPTREVQPIRDKRMEPAQPVQREKPQMRPANEAKPMQREPSRVEPVRPAPVEKPQMERARPVEPRQEAPPQQPRMEVRPIEPSRPQMEPARPMSPPQRMESPSPSPRPQMGAPSSKPPMGNPRSSSEQNVNGPAKQTTMMPPLRTLSPKSRAPGR